MRLLLSLTAIFISMLMHAQPAFEKRIDNNNELIYLGRFTFSDLEKEPEYKWYKTGIKEYKPDATAIKYLQKELNGFEMVVLMGTWCEDSHNLIPKLYKVLKDAGYTMSKLTMYGLDDKKIGPHHEEIKYKVSSVPTIIVYSGVHEAGRIIESVKQSIEADLAEIVRDYEGE